MTINITNKEADALTRRLARLEGVGVTAAVVIAVREALARRRTPGSIRKSVEGLREKYGVVLTDEKRQALPQEVYDELSGEEPGWRERDG